MNYSKPQSYVHTQLVPASGASWLRAPAFPLGIGFADLSGLSALRPGLNANLAASYSCRALEIRNHLNHLQLASVEKVMSLLWRLLPLNFSEYLRFATYYDHDMFSSLSCPPSQDYIEQCRSSLMISMVDDVAFYFGRKPMALAEVLCRSMNQRQEFLNLLTTRGGCSVMNSIERSLHDYSYSSNDLLMPFSEKLLQQMMVESLCKLGCTQTFVIKYSGISHTVKMLQSYFQTQKDVRRRRTEGTRRYIKPPRLEGVARRNQRVRELMTVSMLELYSIGIRVATAQEPFQDSLSLRGIPSKVSLPVAVGAYSSLIDMFSHEPLKTLLCKERDEDEKPQWHDVIPHFQLFHQILRNYLVGDITVQRCPKCGSMSLQKNTNKPELMDCTLASEQICPVCRYNNLEKI